MRLFNIFVNREIHRSFRTFVWRLEDDYVLRMGGIQLKIDHDQKLSINPVYYPLFSWMSKPGTWEFTLYFGSVSYTLLYAHGEIQLIKRAGEEIDERE